MSDLSEERLQGPMTRYFQETLATPNNCLLVSGFCCKNGYGYFYLVALNMWLYLFLRVGIIGGRLCTYTMCFILSITNAMGR